MNEELVILVNEQDKELGVMEKMQAHLEAQLHRAVSVFVFNSQQQWLLQLRALSKYHSAGLWTNTCCSHPRPGEDTAAAAERRLQEEMGLTCELKYAFNFIYRVGLDNNLSEHELDHVFIGFTDDLPVLNPCEVSEYKYMDMVELEETLKENPEEFTAWFKLIFTRVKNELS